MRCPKCSDVDLVRARLDGAPHRLARLPAVCPRCDGLWIHLDAIGPLLELGFDGGGEVASSRSSGEPADHRTGLCPEGHGLMTRAPVPGADAGSGRPEFWLERCATCHGVFFDAGEWHALARRRLLSDLRLLWSEAWRRARRQDDAARAERQWLEEALGADLLARLDALGDALREHPHRAAALAHLGRAAESKALSVSGR